MAASGKSSSIIKENFFSRDSFIKRDISRKYFNWNLPNTFAYRKDNFPANFIGDRKMSTAALFEDH
jgi:hypothetical protein